MTQGAAAAKAGDWLRATLLYKQACDGGDVRACAALGSLYTAGRGVPKDEARAAAFYRQACDGAVARACDYLTKH